jgi:hypothetical protein
MKLVALLRILGCGAAVGGALLAVSRPHASERVGVYDSRVIAYAVFSAPAHQAELRARLAEGKAAQARGDTARYEELKRRLVAEQQALHFQVFSTAPVPAAMARLQERAAAVEREAGVTRFVSKWDEAALRGVAEADRVDVTDLLVRDCALTEAQRKTMRAIAEKPPLPLWQAKLLSAFGRL